MTKTTPATVLYRGEAAAAATVIEQIEERVTRVPLVGSRDGYKPDTSRRSSTIIFDDVYDRELEAALGDLIDARGDLVRRRHQRDTGTAQIAIAVTLDDGRTIDPAWVCAPRSSLTSLTDTVFSLGGTER